MPKEPKSQADKRRSYTASDQFGRPWSVTIEIESGDFTGLVSSAGWEDPLRTPQQFIRPAKNELGYTEMGKVLVDLDAWVRFQSQSMQDWVRTFWKVGKELYAARFDPAEMKDDPYLLEQTGDKPWPSVEAIEVLRDAGHQAHRALLGVAPLNDAALKMLGRDPNERAAMKEAAMTIETREKDRSARMEMDIVQFLAIVPTPSWNECVAWAGENDMDLKEMGRRWKAFKEMAGITAPEEETVKEPKQMETV